VTRSGQVAQPLLTPYAVDTPRTFRLTLRSASRGAYGISFEQTYGDGTRTLAIPVIRTSPAQAWRVMDAVLGAIRSSGHPPSVLAFTGRERIRLAEAPGVRLALILLTTQPLRKHHRVRALVTGINAMSVEETYYWYAKCVGPNAARGRKALRALVGDV
jgi:hypothetical protein